MVEAVSVDARRRKRVREEQMKRYPTLVLHEPKSIKAD